MKNKLNLSLIAVLMAGTSVLTSCSKNDDVVEEPTAPVESNEVLAESFFDKVAYRGAMGTSDWTANWTNFSPKTTVYGATTATLKGTISTNTTLDATKVYLLDGFVYVASGVTLTIPAGTVIRGDQTSKGSLIVVRGAKLVAEGTANNPIVFTSNKAVGDRNPGDWGGIILLGKSLNNNPGGTGIIEGGIDIDQAVHGGTDAADNSGTLKYVRVEFPGIAFVKDNEINGITFGSVGSGTTIDYVQVSYSGDDSYEFFGGTVNAKHLVSIANVDDIFDFDNGYSGKLQFLIGQRDPALADAAGQSNGIESDNSAAQFSSTPRTRPVISNMTIIGPGTTGATVDTKHEYANLWRKGSKMILANSIFINSRYGIDIRDKETGDALTDGTSLIKNNIYQSLALAQGNAGAVVADKEVVADGATPSFASAALLRTYLTSKGNTFIDVTAAAALLNSPFTLTSTPNFTLKAGSVAATGATF
ncbi:T9SS C-terminal target domain-containing protein [Pedobacter hiemivivus]|uniref:T9SS C-terminal target domain-containing protein n=1 Tax=Pedobacter hiemivivus TaxID=2530454 RepID=A0A4U1GBH8_9SPHI|nr:T9SS C-terminal target domain-containing protein [Pedobacter hiemivivus]TKC61315.1 T9SS C-terminal target domain-containing protein [Pedobacter hiemivivus]